MTFRLSYIQLLFPKLVIPQIIYEYFYCEDMNKGRDHNCSDDCLAAETAQVWDLRTCTALCKISYVFIFRDLGLG